MRYVKFEDKIRNNIVKDSMRQDYTPSMGIVLKYNREKHEVTIVTARPGSNQLGEMYTRVPCPQTNGVQTVAPQVGRPCWISFPNGEQSSPVVTGFFNPYYRDNDFENESIAINDTPRFMMEL